MDDNKELGNTAVCMEGYAWKRKEGTRHSDNLFSRRVPVSDVGLVLRGSVVDPPGGC